MPCRDYLLSVKEAVLLGIEEISLGLGASRVGSSSLWLEGCWSYGGTKLFRFQSTAAPSPHLTCPWAQRYRLWSDKSLSCKGEEDWHWDRRGSWLPTKNTKPEDEMQCMQRALGSGLVRKETQTNKVTTVTSWVHCPPSRTNCRAATSFPPKRWSSFDYPHVSSFSFFPNLFIYQVWNPEDNNFHSSEEVMSHETKTRWWWQTWVLVQGCMLV